MFSNQILRKLDIVQNILSLNNEKLRLQYQSHTARTVYNLSHDIHIKIKQERALECQKVGLFKLVKVERNLIKNMNWAKIALFYGDSKYIKIFSRSWSFECCS